MAIEKTGPSDLWYVKSGFKAIEYPAGRKSCGTEWSPDGTVLLQVYRNAQGRGQVKSNPPWLWGVTDQTEPTIPEWMKDDELWAKALEEAK